MVDAALQVDVCGTARSDDEGESAVTETGSTIRTVRGRRQPVDAEVAGDGVEQCAQVGRGTASMTTAMSATPGVVLDCGNTVREFGSLSWGSTRTGR